MSENNVNQHVDFIQKKKTERSRWISRVFNTRWALFDKIKIWGESCSSTKITQHFMIFYDVQHYLAENNVLYLILVLNARIWYIQYLTRLRSICLVFKFVLWFVKLHSYPSEMTLEFIDWFKLLERDSSWIYVATKPPNFDICSWNNIEY